MSRTRTFFYFLRPFATGNHECESGLFVSEGGRGEETIVPFQTLVCI